LTAWFEKISSNSKFVKIFGNIKLAAKSLAALPKKAAPAKKVDDLDDLFGDDDDDAEAAKVAAAAAKA
jgi:hypothetical protein